MAGVCISRRSLNSVTQDLAPLMTIEDDDDDDVDEGAILRPPNASSSSSSAAQLYENSSSSLTSTRTATEKVASRTSSCLKVTFGVLLIVAGVVLNVSSPIYTLVMSEKSDIFVMNLFVAFWTSVVFLALWIVQCLFYSKVDRAEEEAAPDSRGRLYFRPRFASFKTLVSLAVLNAIVNTLISFSLLPSRTPKPLQSILGSGAVVTATIFRKILLNRGVSVRRIICLGAVMLGLFVAAEPEIFDLPMTKIIHKGGVGSKDLVRADGEETIPYSVFAEPGTLGTNADVPKGGEPPLTPTSNALFWTVLLLLSNVPAGLSWVLFEREASRRPCEVFLLGFYSQFGSLVILACLFAIDLIPGFGQADSANDFWRRFVNGFFCHYRPSLLPDSHCGEALVVSFACIFSFAGFLTFQVLLMAYSEGGSTFSIIVSYLSVPASSIFWLLFDFRLRGGFVWSPLISVTALFPILGFSIMFPAIVLFNLMGAWESRVTYD